MKKSKDSNEEILKLNKKLMNVVKDRERMLYFSMAGFFLSWVGGYGIGIFGSYSISNSQNKPKSVYEINVNKDNISDLIVESRDGDKSIFIGEKDGEKKNYITLDDYLEEQRKNIKELGCEIR